VNRTTRNLIACLLLLVGVSMSSGCTAHGGAVGSGAGLGQGAILVVAPVIAAAAAAAPVVGILALSPTGPTEYQRNDPRWQARARRNRKRKGVDYELRKRWSPRKRTKRTAPRRWTLKNESSTPLKVTYATGGTLKSKTLKPGKTLELTTDSKGVSYTLRQGKRKKKGTAKPRRGTTLRTVWE
jgi:hypothetical protein